MRFVLLALCCCFCASGCYLDRVYRCSDCDGGLGYSGRFESLVADQRCNHCAGAPTACRDCLRYTLSARSKHMATCGSGCQDMYVDEWISDPPRACDPCDNHGNWTGKPDPCCRSKWASFWTHLWGERFVSGSCCGGQGCSSCTPNGTHHDADVVWQDGPPPASAGQQRPTPAKKMPARPGPAK